MTIWYTLISPMNGQANHFKLRRAKSCSPDELCELLFTLMVSKFTGEKDNDEVEP